MNPECECTFFEEGEWVESRLNPNVMGIVVGNSNFGQLVLVQMAGSLEYKQFYAVTLRHMDSDTLPPAPADVADNVIPVDFTKGRVLTPDTTTEGAA
jgi:hypothetical protein